MSKTTRIIITLIYALLAYVSFCDIYNFLSTKGENYPQIGKTHTYEEYVFEGTAIGVYCAVGILLLWRKKTNKKKIVLPYFIAFMIYLLISMYQGYVYWG